MVLVERIPGRLFRLALLAGLAVIVGCSGSTPTAAVGEQGQETAPAQESTTADSDEPKSLDDYLGLAANILRSGPRTIDGAGIDDALAEQRLVQVEIQRCMQANGFDYTPEAVGDGARFFLATSQTALSPQEYAETEGFGISTRFDALWEGDFELDDSPSPNDELLATLSEGEVEAWQLALRGEPPVRNDEGQLVDPETGEPVQGRGATGGCTRDAQIAVRGDVTELAALADEFAEIETRIAADPRVTELRRAWAACMGDQGFDYRDEAEARAAITEAFRPLMRSFLLSGNQAAQGQGQGQGQGGGGNRLAAVAGLELTPDQELELQALQDRERALATESLVCAGDSGDELAEITANYEEEFIDANRQLLETFASNR